MGTCLSQSQSETERGSGTESVRFTLGMEGAPATVNSLDAGRAYSLCIKPALNAVSVVSSIIAANLKVRARCIVMTPLPPESFLERCALQQKEGIIAAIATGDLILFTMIGDYKKNIGIFGVNRFLDELTQSGVEEDVLVIVDQAEQIFSLHNRDAALEQIEIYHQWLVRSRSTALLLFSKVVEEPGMASGYHAVINQTAGNACLTRQCDNAELWVECWRSGNAVLSELLVKLGGTRSSSPCPESLAPFRDGSCLDSTLSAFWSTQIAAAHDADDMYFLGEIPAAAGMQARGRWEQVNSLIDMIHATREARAAMVIITATKESNWLQVSQAVQAIRANSGPMLRIVILDVGPSIRYQSEMVLLRLGANTVVRDVTNLARFRLLLASLQGQLYLRPSNISFADAVACAVPSRIRGFLPPKQFREKAREALSQARPLDLPCVLIVLNRFPVHDLSSTVGRFNLSREGDFFTAYPDCCHIFLYGCVVVDCLNLLPRLIGLHDADTIGEAIPMSDEAQILELLDQSGSTDGAEPASIHILPVGDQAGAGQTSDSPSVNDGTSAVRTVIADSN